MFTGLIEEIGTVRRIERGAKGARLTIAADTVLENTKIGDSIATNGVCLTVVALTDDSFSADVMGGKPAAFRARQSAERARRSIWSARCLPTDGSAVISYPAISTAPARFSRSAARTTPCG